jgi:hypothetical protein
LDRTAEVDNGPLTLDLADAEVRPGDRGELTWRDEALGSFVLPVGVFSTLLRWDLAQMDSVATAGEVFGIGVAAADGRSKGYTAAEVLNSPTWTARLALSAPFAAGDRLEIRGERLVPGAPSMVAVTLPPLSINVDVASGRVAGTGRVGEVLAMTIRAPGGLEAVRSVQVDDVGKFAVMFPAGQLVPGTWVAVDDRTAPDVTVRRELVAARLRVTLGLKITSIEGPPGAVASISMHHTRDGRDYDARREVDRNGSAWVELPVDVEPTDVLRYRLDDGPVGQFVVPMLTAVADATASMITGQAPPGSLVVVESFNSGNAAPITAMADGSGRYSVPVPAPWQLSPGQNGVVNIGTSGAEVMRLWGILRLDLALGSQKVVGNPGADRMIELHLRDASGRVKAAGDVSMGNGDIIPYVGLVTPWRAALRGPDALPVQVAAGDRLLVDAGGPHAEIDIPAIDFEIDPNNDHLVGRTLPSVVIELDVQRLAADQWVVWKTATTTTDATGRFDHTFADVDVRAGDVVKVTVTTPKGHRISRQRTTNWIYLRLDNGGLSGQVAPSVTVSATVRRAGASVGQATGTSDARGNFMVSLQDVTGGRLLPRSGDTVTVDYPNRPAGDRLQIDLHNVSLDWDMANDTIHGTASPNADVAVAVYKDAIEGGISTQGKGVETVVADRDGGWSLDLYARENTHLVPGMRLEAIELLPSGHRIGRLRYVPQLDFQIGGSSVTGRGDSLVPMAVVLADPAGAILGQAHGITGDDGRISLALADRSGVPVAIGPGLALTVTLGDQTRVVTVPPLDVRVTWAPKTITEIQTLPDQWVDIWQRPGCRPGEDRAPQPERAIKTNSAGNLVLSARVESPPGRRYEFGVTPELGWRYYRLPVRPLILLEHDSAMVAGCAPPLTAVKLTLRDQSGTPRGGGVTKTDANGEFRLRVDNSAGVSVAVAEGDHADLEAAGETASTVAEPLWLQRKPDGSLMGGGLPDRLIVLVFQLPDGRRVSRTRRTGPEGEFSFSIADMAVDADWSPILATSIWAYMATSNDHFVGVAAVAAPPPVVKPSPLYLPFCQVKR